MKIKFNRSALQEALGLVTSVVPSRTPKPILQCLRITATNGEVFLSGTDLEIGINCKVSLAEVITEGDVVLPADRVAAIVRESGDDVIEFEAVEATINIKGSDSHFTIYGHDLGQYPQVPGAQETSSFTLSLGNLQDGIELTLFAAAKESSRYAINGILCEINGSDLVMVGTDGRRLARVKVSLNEPASDDLAQERIIIPAKTMSLLDKLGGSGDQDVLVSLVNNQIILSCGDVVISSNLVEGNFPKYEDIIPENYDKKVILNTDQVLSAVRRAALLISEDSKGVKLALGNGVMVFSSRAPETGDAQINMPVEYDGENIEVGFNPQFLTDVLKVIKEDSFEMELGQADRPALIRNGGDFIYVVMPVNLG